MSRRQVAFASCAFFSFFFFLRRLCRREDEQRRKREEEKHKRVALATASPLGSKEAWEDEMYEGFAITQVQPPLLLGSLFRGATPLYFLFSARSRPCSLPLLLTF